MWASVSDDSWKLGAGAFLILGLSQKVHPALRMWNQNRSEKLTEFHPQELSVNSGYCWSGEVCGWWWEAHPVYYTCLCFYGNHEHTKNGFQRQTVTNRLQLLLNICTDKYNQSRVLFNTHTLHLFKNCSFIPATEEGEAKVGQAEALYDLLKFQHFHFPLLIFPAAPWVMNLPGILQEEVSFIFFTVSLFCGETFRLSSASWWRGASWVRRRTPRALFTICQIFIT